VTVLPRSLGWAPVPLTGQAPRVVGTESQRDQFVEALRGQDELAAVDRHVPARDVRDDALPASFRRSTEVCEPLSPRGVRRWRECRVDSRTGSGVRVTPQVRVGPQGFRLVRLARNECHGLHRFPVRSTSSSPSGSSAAPKTRLSRSE